MDVKRTKIWVKLEFNASKQRLPLFSNIFMDTYSYVSAYFTSFLLFLFTYFKKDPFFSLFLGQLFCSDQQGPHVILAFFTSKDNNKHATKTVTFDLNAENLQEIPMLDKYEVDLSQPVSEIQLFLTAITDYKINNDGNLFHRR